MLNLPQTRKSLNSIAMSKVVDGDIDQLATTVLVNNIHCASCVSCIKGILCEFGDAILEVNVNLVGHEVHVRHGPSIKPLDICRKLFEEAFEVDSAFVVDQNGSVVLEQDFQTDTDGWLDAATDVWTQAIIPCQSSDRASITRKGTSQRHLNNCVACQIDGDRITQKPARTLSLKRNSISSLHSIPIDNKGAKTSVIECETCRTSSKINHKGPALFVNLQPSAHNNTRNPDSATSISTLTLKISGMISTACTSEIRQALQHLAFVESAEIDRMKSSATIRLAGHKEHTAAIIDAVEAMGYDASILSYNTGWTSETEPSPSDPNESLCTALLMLEGMTCASCSNSIVEGLHQLPYVESINITLMTNSGVVQFRGKDHLSNIIETVEDMGYGCSSEGSIPINTDSRMNRVHKTNSRTVQLKVDGMFCDHCPAKIADALTSKYSGHVRIDKLPDIKTTVMTITYGPHSPECTIRDIIATINSSHQLFQTTIHHPPSPEERSRKLIAREKKKILGRLLISAVVAVPTLLIGVVWMSLVSKENKIRMFFEIPMWSGYVTRAEWALFIMATIVMFSAANAFHVPAFKEIRATWRRGSRTPILQRFYRFGTMNLLVSAGTNIAYIASLALLIVGATTSYRREDTTTYFDTVIFLTFFILVGRYLEVYSKSKAGDAVSLLGNLRPLEATLIIDDVRQTSTVNDQEKLHQPTRTKMIKADLLEVGDTVIVPRGSSPPADGSIFAGCAQFDESSLTGESRIVRKEVGDQVHVGTVNIGDPVTVKITGVGGSSMLDQIIAVVREGRTKQAPVERFADILTAYFVPIITALAIVTFFVWFSLGQSGALAERYLHEQMGGWAFWSLEFAIAVFVVACPCGIGLAAPTALFVGGGLAAKYGILVQGGGEAFEEAGIVDAVVFDKTGTLTEGGGLQVTDHELLGTEEEETFWSIVKALEEQSSHPIARAIHLFASQRSSVPIETQLVREIPGRGVRGIFVIGQNQPVTYEAALGSETFLSSVSPNILSKQYFTSQTLSRWQTESKSVAILAIRRQTAPSNIVTDCQSNLDEHSWHAAAIFATTDRIRPSALPTIQNLKSRGIAVYMLSGDNPSTAKAVASSLGIPVANVFAGVLPTEKAEKIQDLIQHAPRRSTSGRAFTFLSSSLRRLCHPKETTAGQSRRPAKVVFVGDGINDAPALLAATVSISLSTGSSIAQSSSSFILLSSSLLTIPLLFDLSVRVFRRIKFNFFWALAYNVILVPVAAGVLFKVRDDGWRLGPVWASAAMAGSSVSVVVSSLLLRWEGRWQFWKNRNP